MKWNVGGDTMLNLQLMVINYVIMLVLPKVMMEKEQASNLSTEEQYVASFFFPYMFEPPMFYSI